MDNKVIISDTSCLIALDKIGQLNILHILFGGILTTKKVVEEYGFNLPNWVEIKPVENVVLVKELSTIVDAGEASAIALAVETPASLLIIDEKKGRKLALKYNVHIVGTLQVLLEAKSRGMIPRLDKVLALLENTGFRFTAELKRILLTKAGEL